jgi:hypothetical protein
MTLLLKLEGQILEACMKTILHRSTQTALKHIGHNNYKAGFLVCGVEYTTGLL